MSHMLTMELIKIQVPDFLVLQQIELSAVKGSVKSPSKIFIRELTEYKTDWNNINTEGISSSILRKGDVKSSSSFWSLKEIVQFSSWGFWRHSPNSISESMVMKSSWLNRFLWGFHCHLNGHETCAEQEVGKFCIWPCPCTAKEWARTKGLGEVLG